MKWQDFLKEHGEKKLKQPRSINLIREYLDAFQDAGLIPVPLTEVRQSVEQEKPKFVPMLGWKSEIKEKTMEEVRKLIEDMPVNKLRKLSGFAILMGSASRAIVVDVDKEEKFLSWAKENLGVEIEDLKAIADWTARSKKGGWHFWFRVSEDKARAFKTVQRQDFGFDIRGEDGLCNIVCWDRDGNQLYNFVCEGQGKEEEKERFLKDLYLTVYAETKPEVELNVESEDILQNLVSVLRKAYESGELDGWTIEAGLSALLVKKGYSDEKIHEVFKEVYGSEYDYKRTQYVINQTRAKDVGINTHFLNFLRSKGPLKAKKRIKVEEIKTLKLEEPEIWQVNRNKIYRLTPKGNVAMVLPKIDVLAEVDVEDKPAVLIGFRGRKILLYVDASRQDFEKALRMPLEHKAYELYKSYISYVLSFQEVPKENLYESLGWDTRDGRRIFKHPLLMPDKFVPKSEHIKTVLNQAQLALEDPEWEKENQAFIDFLEQQCEKGTYFAVLYTIGLSSLFINLINGVMPYIVIVTGPSGSGKTTACSIVQNAFLSPSIKITANVTTNAFELIIASLGNVPVLFDELKLSRISPEDLVFAVSSGGGKARANTNLAVKTKSLRSVVFLTSEVMPQFERQGAERRILNIHLEDRECAFGFAPQDLSDSIRNAWGHGLTFVKPLLENENLLRELKSKAVEWIEGKGKDNIKGFVPMAIAIMTSSFLMEHVLGISMENVRQRIYDIILNQFENFRAKEERLQDALREFIIMNINNFYQEVLVYTGEGPVYQERKPIREVWGRIVGNDVYLLREAMREFSNRYGLDERVIVKLLRDAGILKPDKNRYDLQVKSIGNHSTRVYVLEGIMSVKEDREVLLEEFLVKGGIGREDTLEIVEMVKQSKGIDWLIEGNTLRWKVDGTLVEGMDITIEELRSLGAEAKEHVLIIFEKVCEFEPAEDVGEVRL